MDGLVSIVVPVYNVEEYLNRCIDSLLKQTYEKIEILLIDDGSTDNSSNICRNYLKKNKRIKYFKKPNEGLGLTRNYGIEHASGEYIIFVDSDDYIPEDAIEFLVNRISDDDVDMVVATMYYKNEKYNLNIDEGIYNIKSINNVLLNKLMGNNGNIKDSFLCTAPAKIYKKDLFVRTNVRFPSERELIWEDLSFFVNLLPKCEKVSVVNYPVYVYCYNQNSLTHSYKTDKFEKVMYQYKYLLNKIEELKLGKEARFRLDTNFIGHIRTCLKLEVYYSKQNGLKMTFGNIRKICSDKEVIDLLDNYPNNKYNFQQKILDYFIKNKNYLLIYLLVKLQNIRQRIE